MTDDEGAQGESARRDAPAPRRLPSLQRSLARFARWLGTRRGVLWVLSIVIAFGVTYGSWKTLTLPAGERFTGEFWRTQVVNGVTQGSVYALIALGYSLVYGILLMINFAHGEVFMAGTFGSFFVAATLDRSGFLNDNLLSSVSSLVLLFLVAMAVSTFVAVLLERIAYRPLRNAPRLVPLITAIGASLFLQNTFRGFFGPQTRGYPSFTMLDGQWRILGVGVQRPQVVVIGTAIVAMLALTWLVTRTKTGRSMRAVSQDKEIAALMGINVDRIVVITFAIGGMMAGIAGILYALTFQQVQYNMGFVPGIKAFTAAVLGGIGSITGAALGGLILGILEAVGPVLLLRGAHVPSPNQLQDLVAFSILVLVLIFRPGGILGSGEAEKV